jgi:hypothetical protein
MPNSTAAGEPEPTMQLVDGTIPGTADLIGRPSPLRTTDRLRRCSAPHPSLDLTDSMPPCMRSPLEEDGTRAPMHC